MSFYCMKDYKHHKNSNFLQKNLSIQCNSNQNLNRTFKIMLDNLIQKFTLNIKN